LIALPAAAVTGVIVTVDVAGGVGVVTGALTGFVTGALTGTVTGALTGTVTGALTGTVTGALTGGVTGGVVAGGVAVVVAGVVAVVDVGVAVATAVAALALWLESPPQADSASAHAHAINAGKPRHKTSAFIPFMCASARDAFQHFIRRPLRAQLSLNRHVVRRRHVTQITGRRGDPGAAVGVEDREFFQAVRAGRLNREARCRHSSRPTYAAAPASMSASVNQVSAYTR
jgi:hypothetical protein